MDMSLGEGMKLLISGGAVIPEYDAKKVKEKNPDSSDRSRTGKTEPDSS
jgi:uncharacterized membrane protein